jgi:hypothetical protein
MTPEEEKQVERINATHCIPYVLGYLTALESRVLPANRRQFSTGMSNAQRDMENGVVALWDLDISKHVETLICLGEFPLLAKNPPGRD